MPAVSSAVFAFRYFKASVRLSRMAGRWLFRRGQTAEHEEVDLK
jgi:hypothetical protein